MKKKFITLLILLLIPAFAWASGRILFMSPGASACDSCAGDTQFAWHMENVDVTLGSPCGCSDEDEVGAIIGSPALSETQESDGTHSAHFNAGNEYYAFDQSSGDLLEQDSFKITFDIYVVTFTAYGRILTSQQGINDYMYVALNLVGGNGILVDHKGDNNLRHFTPAIGLSTGIWYSVEIQGKVGVAGNDSYINVVGIGSFESDQDLVVAPGTSSATVEIGQSTAIIGEYYIDNLKIAPCDRY